MVVENAKPCTLSVFRSEEMSLCHLLLQTSISFDVTCELGDLGIIEFRDLNVGLNAFQRTYVDDTVRIEKIEQKLKYLDEQLLDEPNIIMEIPSTEPKVLRYRDILRLESNIDELDRNLRDINQQLDKLKYKQMQYNEMNHVLLKTHKALEFARTETRTSSFLGDLMRSKEDEVAIRIQRMGGANQEGDNQLKTITGVIRANKAASFHTLIWRMCGNNVLVQFFDIETPIEDVKTNELVTKKVFLIICQGEQLHKRLTKICEAFHSTLYAVPVRKHAFREMSFDVDTNLKDLQMVIEQTLKQKYRILMSIAQKDNLHTWKVQVAKLKAVFYTMNLYRKTDKGFIGEGWCAKGDLALLQGVINQATAKSGVQGQAVVEIICTDETPPTCYRMNKFTQGFQNIVESYGIASYREMNPAPFTVISFPFLFAVMFADAGHGLIMFLFALWMVLYEGRLKGKSNNEIWLTFFDGRYTILLMSMFSMYTGFIYNDVFSKSVNFFGTKFITPTPETEIVNQTIVQYFPEKFYLDKSDETYPFGIDPMWQMATNKIIFLNSFKMKLSVILGVMQMFFGVVLSLFNYVYFRDFVSVVFVWIPQVLFLLCLFGYMNVLIFAKWLMVFNPANSAPSILIDFINMFLVKYPTEPQYLKPWFPYKKFIQFILLGAAVGSIPIMLLVKPTIKIMRKPKKSKHNKDDIESNEVANNNNNHNNKKEKVSRISNGKANEPEATNDMAASAATAAETEHEESVSDIYIHQTIHTIEYCLGSVSHTASYLRLWALSLAHSQLSEVLWSMVMRNALSMGLSNNYLGGLVCYVIFAFWAILTVAILIVMEGLSAFLHAIRLHWVEFQSKFYEGAGYTFKPFSFEIVLQGQ